MNPQILELMKNTLPSRLYPILFPIDNLIDTVTTATAGNDKEENRQAKDRPITCHSIYVSE